MYSFEEVREIFREWQSATNEINALKPQAWECTDEDKLAVLSGRMALLKEKQIDVLTEGNRREELSAFFRHISTDETLSDIEKAEVRENFRCFAHTAFVPKALSARFQAMAADVEAKWALFDEVKDEKGNAAAWEQQAAYLERSFAMRREMALPVAQFMGVKPSEVALDLWNPHIRNKDVDGWLTDLDAKVKPLIREHYLTPPTKEKAPLPLPSLEGHEEAVHVMFASLRDAMIEASGWDKDRLKKEGVTVHPMTFGPNGFCHGDYKDIRMCVEFVGGDFMQGLTLVVHETAHLLYTLSSNTSPEPILDTPTGVENGSATHEICSMTMEQAFRQKEFAPILEDLVVQYLPEVALDENGQVKAEWKADNLIKVLMSQDKTGTGWYDSQMSLAPNMVYRTLAERKILDGELAVRDLPEFWSETMEDWTGIPHDKENFYVAESHWFDDNAGYFWTYVFGDMAGSAVQEQVKERIKSFPDASSHQQRDSHHDDVTARFKDHFKPYIDFLNEKIFEKHCIETPLQIVQGITGENTSLVNGYQKYIQRLVHANRDSTRPSSQLDPKKNVLSL